MTQVPNIILQYYVAFLSNRPKTFESMKFCRLLFLSNLGNHVNSDSRTFRTGEIPKSEFVCVIRYSPLTAQFSAGGSTRSGVCWIAARERMRRARERTCRRAPLAVPPLPRHRPSHRRPNTLAPHSYLSDLPRPVLILER